MVTEECVMQQRGRLGNLRRRGRRLAAAALLGTALGALAQPAFVVSPYKHAPIAFDAATQRLSTAAGGKVQPLPRALPPAVRAVSWAFATGECGQEQWGPGIDTQRFARANVRAFVQAGVGYIVSTGGQGGRFTCASDDGMERFIARYDSPRLLGIDFDIEATQSDAEIDALAQRVAVAERRHPRLRFSFTLPTFAAEDAGRASVNALGERVLAAIGRHHLAWPVINLMVMDYGEATPAHCVVVPTREGPRCDMGRSALQAAQNLHARHGVPLAQIELTPMIGVNDVTTNVFTLADARALAVRARSLGLAGLHDWSLDRDTACASSAPAAQSDCSGVAQAPFDFARALAGADEAQPSRP
jgi:hypothetical protein